MDVVLDALFDGGACGRWTAVDAVASEVPAIDVYQDVKGGQSVAAMKWHASVRGPPRIIRVGTDPRDG